jgi:Ca2+-binding EF-hand superfamily protein
MDTNQQLLQNIVEFISQTVSLNRRLDKKKVDNTTAKLAFSQLDKKRKGYLDLADVYSLCGESTEDDLFVVFKWLDVSKTGDVTYEDFQQVMTTQSQSDKK